MCGRGRRDGHRIQSRGACSASRGPVARRSMGPRLCRRPCCRHRDRRKTILLCWSLCLRLRRLLRATSGRYQSLGPAGDTPRSCVRLSARHRKGGQDEQGTIGSACGRRATVASKSSSAETMSLVFDAVIKRNPTVSRSPTRPSTPSGSPRLGSLLSAKDATLRPNRLAAVVTTTRARTCLSGMPALFLHIATIEIGDRDGTGLSDAAASRLATAVATGNCRPVRSAGQATGFM
jgi:hypothetical protein